MHNSRPPLLRRLLDGFNHAGAFTRKAARLVWVGTERTDRAGLAELQQGESRRRGFDIADANIRKIALLCLGLLIGLAASMVFVGVAYNTRLKTQTNAFGEGFRGGAAQRTPIEQTWRQLDADIASHLGGYRWIDKDNEVVQIPIERAMTLIQDKEVPP